MIRSADGGDPFGEVHEGGDAAAACPGQPALERFDSVLPFDGEHVAQAFFEEVAAVETRVGLGDPVELVALAVGEVLGVLPQRVAGVLERSRVTGRVATAAAFADPWAVAARVVPGLAADLVERLGGPLDDVERVGALHRVRAAFGDDLRDPFGLIG